MENINEYRYFAHTHTLLNRREYFYIYKILSVIKQGMKCRLFLCLSTPVNSNTTDMYYRGKSVNVRIKSYDKKRANFIIIKSNYQISAHTATVV